MATRGSSRAPYGNRTSAAGIRANVAAGYVPNRSGNGFIQARVSDAPARNVIEASRQGLMPYYDRLSPQEQEKLSGIKGWMDREEAAMSKFEAQARVDLLNTGYSEMFPEISTFFQTIKGLPQDQQDSIMSRLREQANASVDKAFDSEAGFITAIRDAKLKNYDDQLALFKREEQEGLDRTMGEIGRSTSGNISSNFFAQAGGRNLDSGQLRSFADRQIEEYTRQSNEEKAKTDLEIAQLQQSRDAATNITNLNAEMDLKDVRDRRTAARAQRLSELMGLQASQDLLLQTPTALDTTLQSTAPVTRVGSTFGRSQTSGGTFVRAPYGNRTSAAGRAANASAGYGTTVPVRRTPQPIPRGTFDPATRRLVLP